MLSFGTLIHEIQGRLASISMFSAELEVAIRRHDEDWVIGRLRRINRAATELQRIVDVMKRLEDDSPPQRSQIDLSALSAKVIQGLVDRIPEYRRTKISVQPNICLTGDSSELEIVLSNIIGNSMKFSAPRECPEVRISAKQESSYLVVHVTDNGVGLAPEDSLRIFEPFTRCHPGFEGSGLGLMICRRIVERHSGCIWASGKPNLGATVSFSIQTAAPTGDAAACDGTDSSPNAR